MWRKIRQQLDNYIYIYIYIKRERERERERDKCLIFHTKVLNSKDSEPWSQLQLSTLKHVGLG